MLPGLRSLGDAEHPWPEAGRRPGRNPTGLGCSGAGPHLIPWTSPAARFHVSPQTPSFPLRRQSSGPRIPHQTCHHLPGLTPLQPAAEPPSASSRPLQRLRLHPPALSLHTPGLVPRRLLGGVTRVPQSHGTCLDQVGHQAEARRPGSERGPHCWAGTGAWPTFQGWPCPPASGGAPTTGLSIAAVPLPARAAAGSLGWHLLATQAGTTTSGFQGV